MSCPWLRCALSGYCAPSGQKNSLPSLRDGTVSYPWPQCALSGCPAPSSLNISLPSLPWRHCELSSAAVRLTSLPYAIQSEELSAFTTWRHCELSVAVLRLIWLLCTTQSQLFSAFTSVAALRVVFGCGAPYPATVRRPVRKNLCPVSTFLCLHLRGGIASRLWLRSHAVPAPWCQHIQSGTTRVVV